MGSFNVEFNNLEKFQKSIGSFNPNITRINEINGKPISEFGTIDGGVNLLTFRTHKDMLPENDEEVIWSTAGAKNLEREDVKSFLVSDRYQITNYDDSFRIALDGVYDAFGEMPHSVFGAFEPGRVKALLNFRKEVEFRPSAYGLMPFESIVSPAILDYSEHGEVERYGTSLLLDIGFNGKNAIRIIPTHIRVFCRNLCIAVKSVFETDVVKHIGDVAGKMILSISEIEEKMFEDYTRRLSYADFENFVITHYGKKAGVFLADAKFPREIQEDFRGYYGTQVISMLNRGVNWVSPTEDNGNRELMVKGFGVGDKATKAFKGLLALQEAKEAA